MAQFDGEVANQQEVGSKPGGAAAGGGVEDHLSARKRVAAIVVGEGNQTGIDAGPAEGLY
jgi:hypothetical protein